MEKKLSVRNLKVSFRTVNGKVQAVRDISFDLNKGETLAIVGESGSGKSVTSRAILGILANNAIIEGGQIIYDGRDLLHIPEDEFYKIRGDKIAMIFQDPMSSLNPVMRIGNQLTEAMLLKNKTTRQESKAIFNRILGDLEKSIVSALNAGGNDELIKEIKRKIKDFDTFEYKHIKLEQSYNTAFELAVDIIEEIKNAIFEIEKKYFKRVIVELAQVIKDIPRCIDYFVVRDKSDKLLELNQQTKRLFNEAKKTKNYAMLIPSLKEISEVLEEAIKFTKPDFFSLGYYLTFESEEIPQMSVEELNKMTLQIMNDKFMRDFVQLVEKGVEYQYKLTNQYKKQAMAVLTEQKKIFEADKPLTQVEMMNSYTESVRAVTLSINNLLTVKDSIAYTFCPNFKIAIKNYIKRERKNIKEAKRFARQTVQYNKLVEKGKTLDWKVVPADILDLGVYKKEIVGMMNDIISRYTDYLSEKTVYDVSKEAESLVEFLKEKASLIVYTVTPRMARAKAIKLFEEVGIAEPRTRFYQYPFEFSGGMRQRIVIAIALSANPDILICDEPTTALDVTIQAQILELINKLKTQRQLTVIFITHDFGVVANMADRIAVMYAGKIVEIGTALEVFHDPRHPYTCALLSSMPDLATNERLESIPGTPPNMIFPPKGDAFAIRNKYAMKVDFELEPPMFKITDTHYAATWLLHPNAPKVEKPKVISDRIERMRKLGDEKYGEK